MTSSKGKCRIFRGGHDVSCVIHGEMSYFQRWPRCVIQGEMSYFQRWPRCVIQGEISYFRGGHDVSSKGKCRISDVATMGHPRGNVVFSEVATMMSGGCLLLLLLVVATSPASAGLLFPRDSPSRESKSLDGLWNFKTSPKVKYSTDRLHICST